MPKIGLKNIHFAKLTDDPVGGSASYDTPKAIIGAVQANVNPNPSTETFFADNGPMETASTLGQIELELQVGDISHEDYATLLGHTIDSNGVMHKKAGDTPPWVAVGFESLKANGSKKYTWLLKGKFQEPENSNETKSDSINFQPQTINGSFVKRDSDDEWENSMDEDSSSFDQTTADAWFDAVYS